MARQFAWMLAALFVCTAPIAARVHDRTEEPSEKPQQAERRGDRGPERVRWWEDAKWRAELRLSDKQAAKIKDIFEVEMVKLRAMREERQHRETALTLAMAEERSNLATITEQVDRVATIFADMYRTRMLMLFRMERVLTSEQRTRLRSMFEKMENEHRRNEQNRRH